jgi:hypothetical protein
MENDESEIDFPGVIDVGAATGWAPVEPPCHWLFSTTGNSPITVVLIGSRSKAIS